jgi:hypothetical protein
MAVRSALLATACWREYATDAEKQAMSGEDAAIIN